MGPLSNDSIRAAIERELASNPLPAGTRGALIAHANIDSTGNRDVTLIAAERVGDHWTLNQNATLHNDALGNSFQVGVSVVASW